MINVFERSPHTAELNTEISATINWITSRTSAVTDLKKKNTIKNKISLV
jgi:hypothetical protein